MKATELMIGDWVFEAGRNAKVIRLNEKDCFVRPIPLTAEILEKNGWKWDKYWEIWKHKSIPYWEFALDERFNWVIKKECYTDGEVVAYLPFVHELQHALRLCGLDELADNFQID